MTRITLTSCLLFSLSLFLGCGGPPAPRHAAAAALPGAGPSWIAPTRAAPSAGRLVVGLLVERRDGLRLADLLPPEKLRAWLAAPTEPRPLGDVVLEGGGALERTWGEQARTLRSAAMALRAEHGLEVEFREVLADEVAGLPLVLVGTRRLHAEERADLAPYREAGGRLLQLGREVLPQAPLDDAAATLRALRAVLAESPLVHVLPRDPLAVTAQREGDDVLLTLPGPGIRVRLEDGAARVLAAATTDADGRARLPAPDPALDPFVHHVVLDWQGDGLALTRAQSVAALVGTVETTVEAGDEVHAGGVTALRIRAHLGGKPVADRAGRVEIVREDAVLAAGDYRTDEDGFAYPRVALGPGVPPGPATLRCDGLEHAVRIVSGLRLSVVTDRPLYKQDDAVHVRLMAHRAGDGRPVAGQQVELALGDAKRMLTTSEHGIAAHTFELVDARVGASRVVARAENAEAACAFRVKAFERPTFTLEAEPAALALRPGESAPLVVTARYVNGAPFVGGQVEVVGDGVELQEAPPAFDARGRLELAVKAREGGDARVRVSVQDAEGRRGELEVPVAVHAEGPRVDLRRISDLAVGVPARFEITCSEPGTVRVGGNVRGPEEIAIGKDGRAELSLTPTRATCLVRLIPERGGAREWQLRAEDESAERDLVLALDRRGARVGESLGIDLRSGSRGGAGLVQLEVWKGDTPVFLRSARLAKGSARVDLPLDASMAGVLQVRARFADGKGTARRATVLVTRGRALAVEATAAQPRHAPGTSAQVDVSVRTADGEPTAAVLGYWGVDEALLALAPATTGHERVFDAAPPSGQAEVLALAEAVDRRAAIEAAALADLFTDSAPAAQAARTFAIALERTPRLAQAAAEARTRRVGDKLARLWEAYGTAWKDLAVTDLVRSDSVRQTLQWLVRRGRLDPALLLDPWGSPLALWSDRRNVEIRWVSAGPDRRLGTADDVTRDWDGLDLYETLPGPVRAFHEYVRVHHDPARLRDEPLIRDDEMVEWEEVFEADGDLPFEAVAGDAGVGLAFEGPATAGTIGIAGGAGGAFPGRGGSLGAHAGSGGERADVPLYVRRDFDPTLCFVPEAIVGPDGRARLQIPLKDSITTWRLRLVASAPDGATGVGEGSIRVGQAVHAAPWLAPHLTVGDVIEVPVAVRNEEAFDVQAQVSLGASDELRLLSAGTITVPVVAHATGRAIFRLEALRAGRARVDVEVDTGGAQDRQQRILTVHPDARAVVAVTSGSVTADMAFPTDMGTPGEGEVRMDLYPSPLAEVLSGFDGLIAAPHG